MFECQICLILLTICGCYGQNNTTQYVLLDPFNSGNASWSCRTLDGLIHEVDSFVLSAKVQIFDSLQNVIAIYGLSTSKNGKNPVASKIFGSFSCLPATRLMKNTCVCVLKQESELRFLCNVTASCKLLDKMYFYMYFNSTFYNSPSVLNPKIYARCERSRGPFSSCYDRNVRRVITWPYTIKDSQIRCGLGLIHELDIFNMTGFVITTGLTKINSETYMSFLVMDDDGSKTFMAMTYSAWGTCSPAIQMEHGVCGCVGVDVDVFRIECNFMADKRLSEKYGSFYLKHRQTEYHSTAVKLPRVIAPNITESLQVDGGENILTRLNCSQTFRAGTGFTLKYCVRNFHFRIVLKMKRDSQQIALSSSSCTAVNVTIPVGSFEFTFSYIDGCHVQNSTTCVFVGFAPPSALSTPCKGCHNASRLAPVESTDGTPGTSGTATSSVALGIPAFIIVMVLLLATAASYLCYRKRFLLSAKTSQVDTSIAESDNHANNEKGARPVIEHRQISSATSNDVDGQDFLGSSKRYDETSL